MTSAELPTLIGSRTPELSPRRLLRLKGAWRFDSGPPLTGAARAAAELDSAASPEQPVLLAEVDGQLRAALALTGGAVIADPFHPTADLIDLLYARANQLDATPRIRRSRRLRSRSRLRAPAQR
jgi:hypothetical protein